MRENVLKYIHCLLLLFMECLYLSIEPSILIPELLLHLRALHHLIVHRLDILILHEFRKGEWLDLDTGGAKCLGISERLPIAGGTKRLGVSERLPIDVEEFHCCWRGCACTPMSSFFFYKSMFPRHCVALIWPISDRYQLSRSLVPPFQCHPVNVHSAFRPRTVLLKQLGIIWGRIRCFWLLHSIVQVLPLT